MAFCRPSSRKPTSVLLGGRWEQEFEEISHRRRMRVARAAWGRPESDFVASSELSCWLPRRLKSHFNKDTNRDRKTVANARFKPPITDCFNGIIVKPHSYGQHN